MIFPETSQSTQLRDILKWDVNSWSKAIKYWDSQVNWNNVGNVLELGAHEGGLSLWLALKGKTVICSDLGAVREAAKSLHSRYQVTSFVRYQDIDATNIPYELFFDVVLFKSIIGGIGHDGNYERQRTVFKEIYRALKPGGRLLFAENLIASPVHQLVRKKFGKWGSSWRYVSMEEIREFLRVFSSYELKTSGFLGCFGRNETERKIFSLVDEALLNRVCPRSWKYIAYGIARK